MTIHRQVADRPADLIGTTWTMLALRNLSWTIKLLTQGVQGVIFQLRSDFLSLAFSINVTTFLIRS